MCFYYISITVCLIAWLWTSLCLIGWLSSKKISGSTCLYPLNVGYRYVQLWLSIYVCVGDLNANLHICRISTLTHWEISLIQIQFKDHIIYQLPFCSLENNSVFHDTQPSIHLLLYLELCAKSSLYLKELMKSKHPEPLICIGDLQISKPIFLLELGPLNERFCLKSSLHGCQPFPPIPSLYLLFSSKEVKAKILDHYIINAWLAF